MILLEANKLSFYRAATALVNEVSFSVKQGEWLSIIGPNGAGKSTLLSLLSGEQQGQGLLQLSQQDISEWSSKALAKQRAVMPQNIHLNFNFTVGEVVLMGRSPYANGLAETSADKALAKQALQWLHLADFWNRDYTELSGGEQQRVQLARVLVQLFVANFDESLIGKVLFLDEAVANLDPAHQHLVFKRLKQLQAQGLTIVNVLHDIQLAAQYSDSVLAMKNSRMLICDEMHKVINATTLEQIYDMPFREVKDDTIDWPLLLPAS